MLDMTTQPQPKKTSRTEVWVNLFIVHALVVMTPFVLSPFLGSLGMPAWLALLLGIITTCGIYIGASIYFEKGPLQNWIERLRFDRRDFFNTLPRLLLVRVIPLYIITDTICWLLFSKDGLLYESTHHDISALESHWPVLFMKIVVLNIANEIFFRGYLQQHLSGHYRKITALILASTIYTLMQGPVYGICGLILHLFSMSFDFSSAADALFILLKSFLVHLTSDGIHGLLYGFLLMSTRDLRQAVAASVFITAAEDLTNINYTHIANSLPHDLAQLIATLLILFCALWLYKDVKCSMAQMKNGL